MSESEQICECGHDGSDHCGKDQAALRGGPKCAECACDKFTPKIETNFARPAEAETVTDRRRTIAELAAEVRFRGDFVNDWFVTDAEIERYVIEALVEVESRAIWMAVNTVRAKMELPPIDLPKP